MANQVVLTFAGDAKQLSRTFDKVNGDANKLQRNLSNTSQKFASGIGKVAKVASIGVGVGAVALAGFGLSAIEAGEALNSIRSQTAAVVESTKGIANVSAKHVKEYSQELSNLAAVDRKVIEASQNVLLTFTNVRNEVGKGNDIFDQGSLAALNMSAALGQDLQSATTMVGKALNDPIQGINAMSRAGIQFTEQQKDQIKTMVESGDMLGAQKIILGELETQFAGSAAANADASDKIKLAFQRITEEIGIKLLPLLDRFADWVLNTGIPAMEDFAGWVGDEVVPKLKELAKWVGDNVVPVLRELGAWITGTAVPALKSFTEWLGENQDVMVAVGIGVAAVLVPAFVAWAISAAAAAAATLLALAPLILVGVAVAALAFLIIRHWDTIKDVIASGWEFVKQSTEAVWGAIKGFLSSTWEFIKGIFDSAGAAITAVVGFYVSSWRTIITTAWEVIKTVFSAAWDFIGGIVDRGGQLIGSLVTRYVNLWRTAITTAWNVIKTIFTTAWQAYRTIVETGLNFITARISAQFARIRAVITLAWTVIRTLTTAAWNAIKRIVTTVIDRLRTAAKSGIDRIVGFFSGLPGRVGRALAGLPAKVAEPFRKAYNKAKEWLDKIPGLGGGGLSVGGFSLGSIPGLATGGIVKATPGGTIARIGEGGQDEAVIPLSRMPELGGGGGVTTLDIRSGGSALDDVLVEVLRKAVQNRGGDVVQVLGG